MRAPIRSRRPRAADELARVMRDLPQSGSIRQRRGVRKLHRRAQEPSRPPPKALRTVDKGTRMRPDRPGEDPGRARRRDFAWRSTCPNSGFMARAEPSGDPSGPRGSRHVRCRRAASPRTRNPHQRHADGRRKLRPLAARLGLLAKTTTTIRLADIEDPLRRTYESLRVPGSSTTNDRGCSTSRPTFPTRERGVEGSGL